MIINDDLEHDPDEVLDPKITVVEINGKNFYMWQNQDFDPKIEEEKLKDVIEINLPKNPSKSKIKQLIVEAIAEDRKM